MSNYLDTTKKLLKLLSVKHTNTYIKDAILSHPDYPSLLSISDTLTKYSVENLAVKIDSEKLKEIPLPCIVQVEEKGTSLFYVLNSYDDTNTAYYDHKNKHNTVSTDTFLEKWTGICLVAEKSEESREPGIEKRLAQKKVINSLAIIAGTSLLSWIILAIAHTFENSFTTTSIFYLLLKFIGLATGIMLLWYEVDKYNPTLQSFCSGGKKVNCEQVLSSKYANLLGGTLSVNALVLGYFFAGIGLLLANGFGAATMSLLGVLSLLGLPIVLYSAYTQAFVIKKWCRFCLVVQGVLLLEYCLTVFQGVTLNTIGILDILLFTALFLLPVLGWTITKPWLEKGKETNMYKRSLQKIKNNKTVFESLLTKSDKITTNPSGLGILLKNETPKYHVVKVCNPYCGPCAKAHPVLDDLYQKGIIDLQVLFTALPDERDRKYKPVSHLLAVDEANKKNTPKALDDWYMAKTKDYDAFAAKYPFNAELQKQKNKIQAMYNWCNAENITRTPTIFINGYELTKEYTINDLIAVMK
ncbi:vitamin K epoxide reductase family protein [Cellulophaga lytica]|nr:vitamin K epoxide reductase family protein [Cellulophaga lytica]